MLASLIAAATLWFGSPPAGAQEPVSTGIIQGLVPVAGMMTIRSDQTTRPMTFYGIERANIFTADGQPAVIDDLQPGMRVTVQYALLGRRWFVSKVILAAERQPPIIAEAPVIIGYPTYRTRAYWDRDITTNPASTFFFLNRDITKRPAIERGLMPVRRRGP